MRKELEETVRTVSSSLGKKVSLAAICPVIFPALVLGYESNNVSMYRVPVPMYNDIFV